MTHPLQSFEDILELLTKEPDLRLRLLRVLLTDDFLRLPERFDRLEETVTKLAFQVHLLAESHKELQQVVKALAESHKELQQEVKALTGEVKALTGEVRTLAGEVKALTGEVKALAGEVKTLAGELDALAGEVKTLTEGHRMLIESHVSLQQEFKALARAQEIHLDMTKRIMGIVESVADSQKELSRQVKELSNTK